MVPDGKKIRVRSLINNCRIVKCIVECFIPIASTDKYYIDKTFIQRQNSYSFSMEFDRKKKDYSDQLLLLTLSFTEFQKSSKMKVIAINAI